MSDITAKIVPLYTEIEGRVPRPDQVDVGEIALSLRDKRIYSKNSQGEIVILGAQPESGANDRLPGGGFAPNLKPRPEPIYRFIWTGSPSTAKPGEIASRNSQWDITVSHVDAEGINRADEWAAFAEQGQPVLRFMDAVGAELYNEQVWEADNRPEDNVIRFNLGTPPVLFPDLLDGQDVYLDLYESNQLPDPLDVIPLRMGDVLRYDGEFWMPRQYGISSLDDVKVDKPRVADMGWFTSPLVDDRVPQGSVRMQGDGWMYFQNIDSQGNNRESAFVAWFTRLNRPLNVEEGGFFTEVVPLTFWIDGIRYPALATAFSDHTRINRDNDRSFTWGVKSKELLDNHPELLDWEGSLIEIEEFNEFLGEPLSYGEKYDFDALSVLQYDKQLGRWLPQPLEFTLDAAANVTLRVEPGSGEEIPKAVGDAFLWNGTTWSPGSPLDGSSINNLLDVNTATNPPSTGQALVWDEANQYWKPGTVASDTSDVQFTDLTDVTIAGPEEGQVVKYTSGVWVNAALVYAEIADAPTVPANLGDLENVDLSLAPVIGQTLVWNGISWSPADQTGVGGGESVAGALTERADVTVTAAFDIDQSRNVEFSGMGEAGKFVQVTVSQPAWIRFYATAQDRDADATRSIESDPLAGSGVLMELRTSALNEVIKVTPGAIYYNNDLLPTQALYARVQNQSGLNTVITTTVRAYTMSATDTIDGGTFGSG
jgi:hypothetical protein